MLIQKNVHIFSVGTKVSKSKSRPSKAFRKVLCTTCAKQANLNIFLLCDCKRVNNADLRHPKLEFVLSADTFDILMLYFSKVDRTELLIPSTVSQACSKKKKLIILFDIQFADKNIELQLDTFFYFLY